MESESSMLPTNTIDVEINEDQIKYANHVHPLTRCEIDEDCSICLETCLDLRTYGCNQCGLYLHECCTKIKIPEEIDRHYIHPHLLKLSMKKGGPSHCEACRHEYSSGLMFQCRACWFGLDVACALLALKFKQHECTIDHIQHFQHPHPLMLCDDEEKIKNYFCRGCEGELLTPPCFSDDTSLLSQSESIYGCLQSRCGYFLHERCARLPREIDNPFHPGHFLKLVWVLAWIDCNGCGRSCVYKCTYQCQHLRCSLYLCVECAFLRAPILKLESHEHLLTLFPIVRPDLTCVLCYEECDSSNIFGCVDCTFYNLHLHCGPLPCSITDKCHIHPLKLMHAFVEDGYEDANDIVYCDACEQPRDPDECVYYCKDCNFIAELKCVEAEVLCSLNGERGNVKLRTANKTRIRVGAKLISNVITDNVETDSDNETEDIGAMYLEVEQLDENFLSAYTDEEREQLREIFKKARVRLRPSTRTFQESKKAVCAYVELYGQALAELQSDEESENGENEQKGLLSNDFKELMTFLDSYYNENEFLEYFWRKDYNIVRIGEHKIAKHVASVLKGLLHKYGNFTAKSKLSERLKAIFLTMLCAVIRSMCLTNVREVKAEVLQIWWKSLKLAQLAGFEIEFAIDQLYKVVQAFFGMNTITFHGKMKSEVDKIYNEIEEEEAKLEKKKRELEELKSRVDELTYKIEYHSCPVLKKCLNHVSELKWKKAWDGSPIMFR